MLKRANKKPAKVTPETPANKGLEFPSVPFTYNEDGTVTFSLPLVGEKENFILFRGKDSTADSPKPTNISLYLGAYEIDGVAPTACNVSLSFTFGKPTATETKKSKPRIAAK